MDTRTWGGRKRATAYGTGSSRELWQGQEEKWKSGELDEGETSKGGGTLEFENRKEENRKRHIESAVEEGDYGAEQRRERLKPRVQRIWCMQVT